jgi:formylmethanofuran dehydrogenase subunit E
MKEENDDMVCRDCGQKGADYRHVDGKMLCSKCIGHYFTCPDCGELFDNDDYDRGDAGNGFCVSCTQKD